MSPTLEIVIRNLLAFLLLWFLTKLIGKQIIANSSYHLYVLSALLGTIAGNMAFNLKIRLVYFLLSLLIIGGIGYAMTYLSLYSIRTRKWILGECTTLIKDGTVLEQNMKKCKFSMDLLEQGLRSKDIFDITEVEVAILETNGTLSVLKKSPNRNATKEDLLVFLANFSGGIE